MEVLTSDDLRGWMTDFARTIEAAQDHLSDLDAYAGDADHGANLVRGTQAVLAALPQLQGPPGQLCKDIGLILVDTIGGSSGVLYGTIFLRLAQAIGPTAPIIDLPTLSLGLGSAAKGISDRGGAQRGDKTMLDAVGPAAEALDLAVQEACPMSVALIRTAEAAETGARATAALQARRGKASYVGVRSIGTSDPGATSAALLLRCLAARATLTSGEDADRHGIVVI